MLVLITSNNIYLFSQKINNTSEALGLAPGVAIYAFVGQQASVASSGGSDWTTLVGAVFSILAVAGGHHIIYFVDLFHLGENNLFF